MKITTTLITALSVLTVNAATYDFNFTNTDGENTQQFFNSTGSTLLTGATVSILTRNSGLDTCLLYTSDAADD